MIKYIPMRSFTAQIDISKFTNGSALFTVPKNMYMYSAAVKTLTAADGNSGTITIKLGDTAVLSNASIANAGDVYVDKESFDTPGVLLADKVATATIGGTNVKHGLVEVEILGWPAFEEPYTAAATNKAPVDPYTPPEKA